MGSSLLDFLGKNADKTLMNLSIQGFEDAQNETAVANLPSSDISICTE
jgi:hypothetical protein